MGSGEMADARFWRKLFRNGQELRAVRWASNIRSAFLEPLEGEESAPQVNERVSKAVTGSGHCSVGVGCRVVKVGGLRPGCPLDYIHAAMFDLRTLTVNDVKLTEDSQKPERRLRHAACEIRPPVTDGKAAVLVLGGCHDKTKRPCKGGLRLLHILELLDGVQALGRWHSVEATGEAPSSIWHHVCGSFSAGTRVVVSGGDFNRSDPEFVNIADRSTPACFVYVLDIRSLLWARVTTTGPAPTWRSLHTGFTHLDISSHAERLVILGGCAAHIKIFTSSDDLSPMDGHALDLNSFKWLPQPSNRGALPPARLRLASEKVGECLLLYGGHGEDGSIGERVQLHKLNLRTLAWGMLDVRGREGSHPAAPAATMSAGLVLGGVKFSMLGVQTVPKLDVLTLFGTNDRTRTDEAGEVASTSSDSDDDNNAEDEQMAAVTVLLGDAQGTARQIVIPRALAALLLARQGAAAGERDDDTSEDGGEDGLRGDD